MSHGFIIYIYNLWWLNNIFYFDEFHNLMNFYLWNQIIIFLCFYFTFLILCWKARLPSSWESLKNTFPFIIFEFLKPDNLFQVLFLWFSSPQSYIFLFESNSWFPKLLELVYIYLCGPMQATIHSGANYFVFFIDDYFQFSIFYFIHQK